MHPMIILLPRKRATGLTNIMCLLADELPAKVIYLDDGSGYSLSRLFQFFVQIRLQKKKGLLIHSSGVVPDIFNAITGSSGASTTIHNFLFPDYKLQYGKIKGTIISLIHLGTLFYIPKKLGCSQSVSDFLLKKYKLPSIPCVNGCRKPRPTNDRKKFSIKENQSTYFFAGPLISRKNVTQVASTILTFDPIGLFIVFGKGPERDALIRLQDAADRIKITEVDDPTAIYRPGDIYISFSLYEGLPLAVLEAVRAGCIPLLSSIPPHQEILDLLCITELRTFTDPRDAIKWVSEISFDERVRLGTKISTQAEEIFSERNFALRFVKSLEQRPS